MSAPNLLSAIRSSDHEFTSALRFLDDYARHVYERGHPNQSYRRFVPHFNLEQHPGTYELYGELPGFRRDDITIEAHDDHNLQISGSIRAKPSQLRPSSESKGSEDVMKSPTKPKDQKDEVSHISESTSTTEVPPPVSGSNGVKTTTTATKNLSEDIGYSTARFGDALDPHSEFVHSTNGTKASPTPTHEKPEVQYLISERHPSAFQRVFYFPTPIKKEEVTAIMQDGILHITAPRAPMPPPVKVQIWNDMTDYSGLVV